MFLSIVIPAYNEERRLPKTLRLINEYLRKQPYDYEILVISDGAKDNTAAIAESLTSEIPQLRVIVNPENHGKGYVVRQGMLAASGDFRVFTDADNSTSIEHLEKVLPGLKAGAGVVIGTRDRRDHPDAKQAYPQPLYRRLLGEVFNLFVQVTLGLCGIWDTQCGFKGYTKEAAEKIFPKCRINRFAFDPETLIIAKKLGYKIKKAPVYWINDPQSTVKFSWALKMGLEVLKIRANMITGKYQ